MDKMDKITRRGLLTLGVKLLAGVASIKVGEKVGNILNDAKEVAASKSRIEEVNLATETLKKYLELEREVLNETNGKGDIYLASDDDEDNYYRMIKGKADILHKILKDSLTINAIRESDDDYSKIFEAIHEGGNMDRIRMKQFNDLFNELTSNRKDLDFFKKAIAYKIYFENYFRSNPIILEPEYYKDEDGDPLTKRI